MKTTILSILLVMATTTVFAQVFPDNVRVVCPCEMDKIMQNPILRSSLDAKPYIIARSCRIHKPNIQEVPEDVYLSQKRKKAQTKRTKGSHIIWL